MSFVPGTHVYRQKTKDTNYGENISALSLKQEGPVMVKPRLLELFNVRISGLSLNQKWRSRVNKGETTSFGTQRLALIRFVVQINKSTKPKAWPHFSKYGSYQVCTKKRLRMSGPWKNTKSFCNSLSIVTFVDTACVFKMMYDNQAT